MKNRIDVLIDRLRNDIENEKVFNNEGHDDQQQVNNSILFVIEEINKILRTCERDLR